MEEVMLNNRYRLLERIGSGGMAVVYKALDTLLERQVAVKVLREHFASDPAFLTRFQREARAAANLDHSNIVTVYDVGRDDDRHYIVMEYVDGQDLKMLIRRNGHLDVAQTLDIATQICAGVGHAHKAGVVHCDLKPQNVLVTQDGRAKVVDFGIARALSESGLTESETVWGSPLYFSPEQAAGDPPTPASDVYSIGVMMYEMLAGSPPFQAEKPTALALMHMREEPPPLGPRNPQVPPRLEWLIRKVLAKEPSARYRSAGQLLHVLEEYRQQGMQMTGRQPAVSQPQASAAPKPPASSYTAQAESPSGPELASEGPTWALGTIAFIAVVGLIPLWWLVYQAYSSPMVLPSTPTPTPLVTRTAEVQKVPVPGLVGKPKDEARRMAERAELRFEIEEEREEAGLEGGVVLEQRPAPGEQVPIDSVISVVVSGAGREVSMVGVVGYPLEMVRGGIESNGLQINVEKTWSMKPEGQIVAQEPEEGTVLHAGDPVTLTVSGGAAYPIVLEVNLADKILLESAELRQRTFEPGERIGLTLNWQALQNIGTPYTVFVHLIGPQGHMAAQQDEEPSSSTTMWRTGMRIVDPHYLTIPDGQAAGRYQLRVGLYPQGQPAARLPVVDAGSASVESNSILIAEVEISP
jgi:serine/threonine-protein kinase